MGLKPGYKQTEIGVIPEDWDDGELGCFWNITDCKHITAQFVADGFPIASIREVQSHFVDLTNAKRTTLQFYTLLIEGSRKPKAGDLILSRNATVGEVAQVASWHPPFAMGQDVCLLRKKIDNFSTDYLQAVFRSPIIANQLSDLMVGSTFKRANIEQLRNFVVPMPPPPEQEAIAEALSDADALIESLELLIAKKRNVKQGATLELLTGKKRLPGFNDEWKPKRIADIATPSSEKNTEAARLPVLTCSKHLGFVDSLSYFKNQVFSNDTSTYKLIRRGQIGYPANHVEEGSIGLQDLYDVALVSPIYVVFSVSEEVDSYFLHRVLKLDSYRHKFKMATSSSVDRRGSLRWPAFSEITVNLPSPPEQTAIVRVLSDMDTEIAALDIKLAKARRIKQGMMHNLLTGSIRLV